MATKTGGLLLLALILGSVGCRGDVNGDDCAVDRLALKEAGWLTLATGHAVYPPWMLDDDPSSGEGFESAVAYAVAAEMSFGRDQVHSTADLGGARLGAAVGSTSLDYIEQVIDPDLAAVVYDCNALAIAALDAGQIDGIVVDLPTAFYIVAVQAPGAVIVGQFEEPGAAPDQLGLLFEEGSALVACVDRALAALDDAGTLASLENLTLSWLNVPRTRRP